MSRAEFEAWAKPHGFDLQPAGTESIDCPWCTYFAPKTESAFAVWKAAERAAVRKCAEILPLPEYAFDPADPSSDQAYREGAFDEAVKRRNKIRSAYPEHFEGE
jgi:hypothetical protein